MKALRAALRSLVVQVRLLAVGLAVLLSITTIAIAVALDVQSSRTQLQEHGRRLAWVASRSAETVLARGEADDARQLIKPFALDPEVVYIALLDRQQRVIAESPAREGFPAGQRPSHWAEGGSIVATDRSAPGSPHRFRDIIAPVSSAMPGQGLQIPVTGYVRIGLTDRAVRQRAWDFFVVLAVVAGAIVATGGVMTLRASRRIVQPLVDLAQASRAVGQGRLEPVPEPGTGDELQELAASFNRMTASLAESRRELELHQSALNAKIDSGTTELRRAKEAAEAASRVKTEFLANISHELRTPINGMLGVARILSGTGLDAHQRKMVNSLQRAGESLAGVVGQLLDFSQLETDAVNPQSVPCDLRALAASVIALFESGSDGTTVRCTARVDDRAPTSVLTDPALLRQVLVNLVGNGLKFTPRGAVELSVVCTGVTAGEAQIRFAVRDTGIGIPPDRLANIFDPFVQGDGSMTRTRSGIGLGLTIARRIINRMGADIQVTSTPGTGSTFSFQLRLTLVEAQRAVHSGSERAAPARPTALVVEDNDLNAIVATELLEERGFAVTVAENGELGVARCAGSKFDLVLMDGQMPVMDGLAATRAIRRMESTASGKRPRRQVIVALTAHDFPEYRDSCMRAGMDDFLAKPLTEQALERVIARWVPRLANTRAPDRTSSIAG